MINTMPTYAAYSFGNFKGFIRAVSIAQAKRRAAKLYGRCEVLPASDNAISSRFVSESHHTDYMRPVKTVGFEARRAALIAEHKAKESGLV